MQLVATTRENVSPFLVLELLHRIAGIIKVRGRLFDLGMGCWKGKKLMPVCPAGLLWAPQ